MALAAALHHSRDVGPVTYNALRSQKTARAEATNTAPRSQTTSVAGDTEFFSLFEEELGGTRPDRMYEVRPQERDQRHTVEQIVDTVLFAPSLDVPVPQMGNQLVDVCRLFDVLIPEQAIEVPKISPTPRLPRRRRVRFAEQTGRTVGGSTDDHLLFFFTADCGAERQHSSSWSWRATSRSSRFSPRQRSTAVHASLERSSERIVEQIVDSRVLGGGFSASSSSSREHAGEGVFRTFPRIKKSPKLGSHSGAELLPESSPSTLSAHQMANDERTSMVDANGHAWVRLDTALGTFWQNLDTGHQQWRPPW